ncbi:Rad52/Rad22 family DNA repair protein [Lactococcus lactis]|uniref:Rad52/Rad22 family DNA repair protein n=1 Tax=Lactococcus lactis TaxID=1358 RepID=UPI001F5713B1|nr:Rad52/Rad22 family DNA repair protein [Lactococcus lactis]
MANYEEQMKALQRPLNSNRVVWRVQQMGWNNDKPWVMVLAYLDNRAVQERFDEVFGIAGWKNEFKTGPDGGILCGISVKFEEEWVTKWDGADKTQVEAVKGGLSGSMKRAAVQWGVGRYLYDLPVIFAKTSDQKVDGWNKGYDNKKNKSYWWETPKLPNWALPNVEPPESVKTYSIKDKHGKLKEVDEAYMYGVVERMAARAGKEFGATIEEQNTWLSMPLDEAYRDIEEFIAIKRAMP